MEVQMSELTHNAQTLIVPIEDKLARMDKAIEDLLAPPFTPRELTALLSATIEVANEFLGDDAQEDEMIALTLEIWNYYESKYDLINKIDDAVDFRKIFGTAVGTIVEQFDGKGIEMLIEKLIIPMLIAQLY